MKPPGCVALCACVLALVASTAAAQTPRPERPYRGLFGGGVGDAGQVLTVSFAIGGGYDDDVLAEASEHQGLGDPRTARSSAFGSLRGSMQYALNKTRFNLGASAGSSMRLYADEIGGHATTHGAGVAVGYQLGRRTTISASQRVSYQPFLTVLPFPTAFEPALGEVAPPQQDFAATDTAYLAYGSSASLGQSLTRRSALSLSYGYTRSDFLHDETNFSNQYGSIRYTYAIGKGLGVRAGYSLNNARHGDGSTVRTFTGHGLDLGVDYDRALSVSRRTTLAFGTGSTAVTDGEVTQYYVTGNARLQHEIGRSWAASLSYVRSAQFLEAFSEPYLSDAVIAAVSGLFHRRVQFNASVAASFGAVGLSSSDSFDTYVASSNVTWAIARYAGFGINYSYYRYRLDSGLLLSESVQPHMDRQSVSAHLTLWAPLMTRGRRP